MPPLRLPLWKCRAEALTFLRRERQEQIETIEELFELSDECVDAYESQSDDIYSTVCGLTTLKAKNLAHGMYRLTLDGWVRRRGRLPAPSSNMPNC